MKEFVYISGPISAPTQAGIQLNKDRMMYAAIKIVHDNPDASPFLPGENTDRLGSILKWDWRDFMRADLVALKKADTVFMCPQWEKSRGARIEERLARMWKKNIVYSFPPISEPIR